MSDINPIIEQINKLDNKNAELLYSIFSAKIKEMETATNNKYKAKLTTRIANKLNNLWYATKLKYRVVKRKVKFLLYGEPPDALRLRMQKIAGITPKASIRLYISDKQLDLYEFPSLFTILRYRLCGIRYEYLKPFAE